MSKIVYSFTDEETVLLEKIVADWKRDTIRFDSVHGGVLDMSRVAVAESIEQELSKRGVHNG
jgi:hypothetical protein